MLKHLRARPRLALALLIGIAAGCLAPDAWHGVTRWLLGWNVAAWFYLIAIAELMSRAQHRQVQRIARAQAESAPVVLGLVVVAAVASLVAIGLEMGWAKAGAAGRAWPHVLLACATVLGAWLLLPVSFTLSYASHFHSHRQQAGGLQFPGEAADFEPSYSDFLYFAFTIAVAAQTSDVTVTRRDMRKLVLLQSVLSFAFNTAILALSVNIAAGLL